MNHIEFAALESQSLNDNSFERWLEEVSRLTGIENLDGDDYEGCPNPDGYSLDQCSNWFRAGLSPQNAANRIVIRIAAIAADYH